MLSCISRSSTLNCSKWQSFATVRKIVRPTSTKLGATKPVEKEETSKSIFEVCTVHTQSLSYINSLLVQVKYIRNIDSSVYTYLTIQITIQCCKQACNYTVLQNSIALKGTQCNA